VTCDGNSLTTKFPNAASETSAVIVYQSTLGSGVIP
jgi:hypothetical protein